MRLFFVLLFEEKGRKSRRLIDVEGQI
jgi:hypothetical protein